MSSPEESTFGDAASSNGIFVIYYLSVVKEEYVVEILHKDDCEDYWYDPWQIR